MTDKAEIEQFIAQAALNNRQAFSQLYDATSTKLYSVCLKVLNNPTHAEDAVQDAYIKIWRSADKYQRNGLSPMTWLITIARNTAIDKLRSLGGHHHSDDALDNLEDSAQSPEAESIAASEQAQIARCLETLEQEKAEAVKSAYLQGATYAELAKKYAVPVNTMRTWLRRSLLKLKGCLTND